MDMNTDLPTAGTLATLSAGMLEDRHAYACAATGTCNQHDIKAWAAVADAYFAEIERRHA